MGPVYSNIQGNDEQPKRRINNQILGVEQLNI